MKYTLTEIHFKKSSLYFFSVSKCADANNINCPSVAPDASNVATGDLLQIEAKSADPNFLSTFDVTLENCWATTDDKVE